MSRETCQGKLASVNEALQFAVQSLDTLGRLADVKGNVKSTLDKVEVDAWKHS